MPLLVPLSAATALGLVLTELISNSYEHAFPERAGRIDVRFERDLAPDHGIITITDDGVGFKPTQESRRHGVGLARRLMQQVEGTLEVAGQEGTTWTLRFPIMVADPAAPVV